MGKRSAFKRLKGDTYQTVDKRAVEALIPFIGHETTFAEPCYGEGRLAADLEHHGHHCNYKGDILTGQDALQLTSQDIYSCELIITNPMWSRNVLHPMIEHLSALKPTWLLFDADWLHTQQASKYMTGLCTDVVSVGRLIWIEGTKMSGKENAAWYRFDINKNHNRGTVLYGR